MFSTEITVDVAREGGRNRLGYGGTKQVEVPPDLQADVDALEPLSMVDARCLFEGPRIVLEKINGVQSSAVESVARRLQGVSPLAHDAALALIDSLGDKADRDHLLLRWRVRALLGLRRFEEAEQSFGAMLALPGVELAGPSLVSLWEAMPPERRDTLQEATLRLLEGFADSGDRSMAALANLFPIAERPLGYLLAEIRSMLDDLRLGPDLDLLRRTVESRAPRDPRVRELPAEFRAAEARAAEVRLLDTMNPLFRAGWLAAPDAVRPVSFHLGGPAPELPAIDQLRVALFCAEAVSGSVAAADRRAFDEAIGLARDFEERFDPQRKMHATTEVAGRLDAAGRSRKRKAPIGLAGICAYAAYQIFRNNLAQTAGACAMAPDRVVGILSKGPKKDAARREATLREFLEALDAELLRLDARRRISEHAPAPSLRVRRVRWIGLESGQVEHLLVTLDAPVSFGLLSKLKGRWRWFEGTRDEVLATVPDEHFEAATHTVVAPSAT